MQVCRLANVLSDAGVVSGDVEEGTLESSHSSGYDAPSSESPSPTGTAGGARTNAYCASSNAEFQNFEFSCSNGRKLYF